MSSQVQWLLLLHCADKVARCIVQGIIFFLFILRHTHTPWFGICLETKSLEKLFFKTRVFILLLVSYSFGDEGQGCLLFKNPCVFFSKKCM